MFQSGRILFQSAENLAANAHDTAGLEDTLYGIAMARKALLPSAQVVNSKSADEVARWLRRE